MSLKVEMFYDKPTFTLTYVVYDENTKDAIIIDPVLNYDPKASKVSYESIEELENFLKKNSLNAGYILETHAHADHLTGAFELKKRLPGIKVAIGENITKVQELFGGFFNFKDLKTDGSQFDTLLNEQDSLKVGSIEIKTIFTPGHTPACSTYMIEDMLFTGDALFMPDSGTGRCDFPAGSADDLYHSIHNKLYELPDSMKVYTGHDYQPDGRELKYLSTLGEQKTNNIQLKKDTSKEEYVKFRTQRDATLAAPNLLLPSVQVNIRAGEFPTPEDNGTSYLKIPMR